MVSTDPAQHEHEASSTDVNTPSIVEKFVIRLPQGLRDQIREISEHNRRSMNSEIIMVLEQYIQQQASVDDISFYEEAPQSADSELSKRLESLSPDKESALLSLLA